MKNKYKSLTGTNPENASDIGIRMEVLAGEVFSLCCEVDWLKAQMFPTTAEGEYLDMHASQRGLSRKSGQKAEGEVDFYLSRQLSYDKEIPAGTIVSTVGENPVRFETTETIVITSGRLSGNAPIRAVEVGEKYNVGVQTISVIVTPIAEVQSVQNDFRTENGTDEENDELLRKRILDSFVNISNGTNKAYYIAQAMSVEGVTSVGVVPKRRGVGTVDVYVSSANGTATTALINAVQEKLQEAREINVDVEVHALSIILCDVYLILEVKSGYDFDTVKGSCEDAIRQYFNTLTGGESVYMSAIGEVVTHVEGVKNYSFVNQLVYDMPIDDDCVARCRNIFITERE